MSNGIIASEITTGCYVLQRKDKEFQEQRLTFTVSFPLPLQITKSTSHPLLYSGCTVGPCRSMARDGPSLSDTLSFVCCLRSDGANWFRRLAGQLPEVHKKGEGYHQRTISPSPPKNLRLAEFLGVRSFNGS